jgi:pSer/pThr/pTyr-binding forkhead associated (FHA) protein/outer membrane biosynthesis protein TonB
VGAAKLHSQVLVFVIVKYGEETLFENSFDRFPITLGRASTCDIPITDFTWISRQHLRLTYDGGHVWAEDLGSANGMTRNGKRHKKVQVEDGDLLVINGLHITLGVQYPDISQLTDPERTSVISHSGVAQPATPVTVISEISELDIPFDRTKSQSEPAILDDKTVITKTATQTESSTEARMGSEPAAPPTESPSSSPSSSEDVIPMDTKSEITASKLRDLDPNNLFRRRRRGTQPEVSVPLETASHVAQQPGTRPRIQATPQIELIARGNRVLEAFVTWKGFVVDTKLCRAGQNMTVGRTARDLYLPTIRHSHQLAFYDGNDGICIIPENVESVIYSGQNKPIPLQDLIQNRRLKKVGPNYNLRLDHGQVCKLNMGHDVDIYFRYAAAPRQLSKKPLVELDEALQNAGLASALVHLLFLLMVVFSAPQPHTLRYKNLSPRIAKLLVQKKAPPPPKVEEKPPEPKKPEVAEKKPEPKPIKEVHKVQPKPKKVIVKTNEHVQKINKAPIQVTAEPKAEKPPEKAVEQLGALAALGALGSPTPNNQRSPVAINVNKDAGGASGLSTSGVIGALKATGGRLESGGPAGVKTQGHGFGTGKGYGVQGLQGRAGSRGVQGAVVGIPKLMKISKSDGLTQKEVMDVVKKYAGQIQQCYERALLSEPSLSGRIEYEWNITPKGDVTTARVKRTDVQNSDALNECVLNLFKAMKFPTAKNGESTTPSIGFPFGRQ